MSKTHPYVIQDASKNIRNFSKVTIEYGFNFTFGSKYKIPLHSYPKVSLERMCVQEFNRRCPPRELITTPRF